MSKRRPEYQPQGFHDRQIGKLPGGLGIVVDSIADGSIDLSMQIESQHLAPNGYLHAASVVALADTAAGYGASPRNPSCRTARAASRPSN